MIKKFLSNAYLVLTRPLRRGWNLGRFPLVQKVNSAMYVAVKDKGGVTEAEGLKIHLDPMDAMGLSVYHHYKPFFTQLCRERITKDSVVVDVGAFIGYFSTIFAGLARKVYAFEPDPDNVKLIVANVLENGRTNVFIEQRAIGDQVGVMPLYVVDGGNTGDQRIIATPGRHSVEVPITTLDAFFSNESVDFIKFDMQGYEYKALLGAKGVIAHNPQIELFVKLTPELLAEQGLKPSDQFNLIKDYGFRIMNIDEGGQELVPMETIDDQSGTSLNLYCIRP